MPEVYEIERKFLVGFPETDKLNIKSRISILQIYLRNNGDGLQRRIRKIDTDGKIGYTYTEKMFLSPMIRKELEYSINEKEYTRLLGEARDDCAQINKVRYCFEYKNQLFELDTYPFSDKLAILELELENAEQEIDLPEYINVIKEVTGDSRYSNAELASAGKFPE